MRLLSCLLCAVFLGCGDSGPPRHCEAPPSSCGGDPTGAWKFSKDSCYSLGNPGTGAGTLKMNGELTLALGADGGLNATTSGTDYVMTLPAAFFSPDAGLPNCEALSVAATGAGGRCTGSSDCVCTYPVTTLNKAGTWSTNGTLATFSFPSTTITRSYCAQDASFKVSWTFGNLLVFTEFTRQ